MTRDAVLEGPRNHRTTSDEQNMSAFSKVPEAPHYDFEPLLAEDTHLQKFAICKADGLQTIDFSSRQATLALTRAILTYHFGLKLLLPEGNLIPTIPNRVQYLSWAANLLTQSQKEESITVLDIGTGPSCIYPMLGVRLFPSWQFVATDTDAQAVACARENCRANGLKNVTVLHTENHTLIPAHYRHKLSLTVCNPPFHTEMPATANPSGTNSQLSTEGGEYAFLRNLAVQSTTATNVSYFTSLVGRKVDVPKIVAFLRSSHIRASTVKAVELSPGGRTTRWAVAWSFGQDTVTINPINSSEYSTWRHSFLLRPGRAYSNQLSRKDVSDIICCTFLDLGWSQHDYTPDLEGTKKLRFRKPSQDEACCADIDVNIRETALNGEFEILCKIHSRGLMAVNDFHDLMSDVKRTVSDFLADD